VLTQGIIRIDHVAIVVANLETTLGFYRDVLGIAPSRVLDFPSERVKIAFLPLDGPNGSEIELLEPTDPESGIARFLEQRGPGLHHICLEVGDVAQALADLQAAGARVLDDSPRPTAEGHGIFLHPKGTGGVLLELVERRKSEEAEEEKPR
jgi:methylmalonyl-CoA epimerase